MTRISIYGSYFASFTDVHSFFSLYKTKNGPSKAESTEQSGEVDNVPCRPWGGNMSDSFTFTNKLGECGAIEQNGGFFDHFLSTPISSMTSSNSVSLHHPMSRRQTAPKEVTPRRSGTRRVPRLLLYLRLLDCTTAGLNRHHSCTGVTGKLS